MKPRKLRLINGFGKSYTDTSLMFTTDGSDQVIFCGFKEL